MHGIIMVFFFLVPSIPAMLGNFLIPIMIGARDLAFPRINLLSWYIYIVGGILALTAMRPGRRRYRLDLLRALQHDIFEYPRDSHGDGRVRGRLLIDPHRPEFHHHHSQDARSRDDVVALAAVRLGALRHQHHPGAGNAGGRHHDRAAGAGTHSCTPESSIPTSAATRFFSSTCSGSTRIPPSTS